MLVQNYAPIAIRMNTYGSIVQRPEPTYQRFYAAPTDCNEIAKFNDRESPRPNRQLLTGPEQGAEQRDRAELRAKWGNRSRSGPWADRPVPIWSKIGAFHLTGQRFLPRNRLLAGRFRPALRFATRGPSLQA
jgi:hypothetical protein